MPISALCLTLTNRSNNRTCTLGKLIKKQIKQIEHIPENKWQLNILKFFLKKWDDNELTKSLLMRQFNP